MKVVEKRNSGIDDDVKSSSEDVHGDQATSARLIFAAAALNLNPMLLGAGIAYTSPALPDIAQDNRCPFHFTVEQESWVAGVFVLGALLGSIGGSFVLDKYGRKLAILHSASLHVVGWLLLAVAWSSECMYVGRIIVGYASGVGQVGVPVYLSEITPAKIRGMFASSYGLSLSIGSLVINLLGCFLDWRWLAVSCIALIALHTCLVVFIAESPRYLLTRGRRDQALQAFDWFNPSCDPKEFRQMEEDIEAISCGAFKQASLSDLKQKSLYVPMLLAAAIYSAQNFSGIDYVVFYTVTIFHDSGVHIAFSSNFLAVVSSLVCVLGGIVASFLFDRSGRRILLMVSGGLCAVSMFALGLHYKLKESDPAITERLALLPITSVAAFQLFYSIGLAAGPSIILSEIVPTRARGLSGAIVSLICWTNIFIVSKLGVTLANSTPIHEYGLFWIFAANSLVGALFIFFCLPETKGKTLEEIEKMFK